MWQCARRSATASTATGAERDPQASARLLLRLQCRVGASVDRRWVASREQAAAGGREHVLRGRARHVPGPGSGPRDPASRGLRGRSCQRRAPRAARDAGVRAGRARRVGQALPGPFRPPHVGDPRCRRPQYDDLRWQNRGPALRRQLRHRGDQGALCLAGGADGCRRRPLPALGRPPARVGPGRDGARHRERQVREAVAAECAAAGEASSTELALRAKELEVVDFFSSKMREH